MLVGGNDGKPVMKDGEPLCIPKEELFEDEPPGLPAWADTPEEIDFMNRVNSEIAEERLEGDSPNSNGDDDTSADPPGSPRGTAPASRPPPRPSRKARIPSPREGWASRPNPRGPGRQSKGGDERESCDATISLAGLLEHIRSST